MYPFYSSFRRLIDLLLTVTLPIICGAFFQHAPFLSRRATINIASIRQHHRTGPLFSSSIIANAKTTEPESSVLAWELMCGDVAWNTLIGEADRSLRLGIELEKSGQARAASAALHEAATLYSCFLESEKDFAHVTALLKEDTSAVLAYLCIRLAFLNLDALGDANAAIRLYKEAKEIDPVPSPFSLEGLATALEASDGGKNLEAALEALEEAHRLDPTLKKIQFHQAVLLDRLGRKEEAEPIFEQIRRSESAYVLVYFCVCYVRVVLEILQGFYPVLFLIRHACKVDSWGYVRWHTRKVCWIAHACIDASVIYVFTDH